MIRLSKSQLSNFWLLLLITFLLSCTSNRIVIEHFGSNRSAPPKSASKVTTKSSSEKVYVVVRSLPEIKGGKKALKKNIIVPDSFESLKTEGFVSIDFFIDELGQASQFNIINSFTNEYDQSVINALKITAFKPGISAGTPQKFYNNIEVKFKPVN